MQLRTPAEDQAEPDWAAFIANDWADQKHDWVLQAAGQNQRQRGQLAHSPEAIHGWVAQLQEQFGERPIAVALEHIARRIAVCFKQVCQPGFISAASSHRQLLPSGAVSVGQQG